MTHPQEKALAGGEGRLTPREREIVDGIASIIEMALPDEIELFQLIKRAPDKSHAGLARFIASSIRNRHDAGAKR